MTEADERKKMQLRMHSSIKAMMTAEFGDANVAFVIYLPQHAMLISNITETQTLAYALSLSLTGILEESTTRELLEVDPNMREGMN